MISLIRDNCDFLQQGIDLLERQTPDSYVNIDEQTFGSSIGSHMRHVLDHYNSLVNGLTNGVVDYDNRIRGTEVELVLTAGIRVAREIKRRLKTLEIELDRSVTVIVSANTRGDYAGSVSTIGRELQFLASHTVHHYALIAIASRMQGIQPPDTYGVAPSTLKYLQAADC
jgi:uncharacterized damage-inducible protein DinB